MSFEMKSHLNDAVVDEFLNSQTKERKLSTAKPKRENLQKFPNGFPANRQG